MKCASCGKAIVGEPQSAFFGYVERLLCVICFDEWMEEPR